MTPEAVLAEVHRRGAIAYRTGDTIRLRPASVLPAELIEAVRQHKAELLPLVADRPPERPPAPSVPPLAPVAYYETINAALTAAGHAAIEAHVRRNGRWVANEIVWLDRRCEELARAEADETVFRAAVVLLIARVAELRRRHEGTPSVAAPRRLVMERNAPVAGPVRLDDGTTIEDVRRFIGRLLTGIDHVLAREGLNQVLPVYLKQLATLGVVARIEVMQ